MLLTRALGKMKSLLRLFWFSRAHTSLTLLCTLWYLISCRTNDGGQWGSVGCGVMGHVTIPVPSAYGRDSYSPKESHRQAAGVQQPLTFIVRDHLLQGAAAPLGDGHCPRLHIHRQGRTLRLPHLHLHTGTWLCSCPHTCPAVTPGSLRVPSLTSKFCMARGLAAGWGATAMLGSARLCFVTVSCSDFSTCRRDGRCAGGTGPTGSPGLCCHQSLV